MCLFSSAIAQTSADENKSGVCHFKPELEGVLDNKNFVCDFILLEKYPFIIGKRIEKNTDEVKLWDFRSGISESIYKVSKQTNTEFQERAAIKRIMTTHDESKVIIYIEYSIPLDWEKYGETNWLGETVYKGTIFPNTFMLVCYSLSEQKIIWQTERIETPKHMPIINLSNIGISYDDKYIYLIGDKTVNIFSTETGETRNYLDFSFSKSLNLANGQKDICFSPSGRYIAYFKNASYMNFNLNTGSTVFVWDDVQKEISCKVFVRARGVRYVSFLPNEQNLLTANNDQSLRLISLPERKVKNSWKFSNGFVPQASNAISICISSGEQQLLLTDKNSSFRIWLYPQMKLIFESNDSHAGISKDGKSLIISKQGRLFLLDTADWSLKWHVEI
jgi:WD40 repeat protein